MCLCVLVVFGVIDIYKMLLCDCSKKCFDWLLFILVNKCKMDIVERIVLFSFVFFIFVDKGIWVVFCWFI